MLPQSFDPVWTTNRRLSFACLDRFNACLSKPGPKAHRCMEGCPELNPAREACFTVCRVIHNSEVAACMMAYDICLLTNAVLGGTAPAPPKWTKEEKDEFGRLARQYRLMALACAAGVAYAAYLGQKELVLLLVIAGAGYAWIAERYRDLEKDPPRPQYEIIWAPKKIPTTQGLPKIPPNASQDLMLMWNLLMTDVPVFVPLEGMCQSVDRAEAARTAGAIEHEARQRRASQIYASAAVEALTKTMPIASDVVRDLQSSSLGSRVVTLNDVQATQAQISSGVYDRAIRRAVRAFFPGPTESVAVLLTNLLTSPPDRPADLGKPFVDYVSGTQDLLKREVAPALARYAEVS